MFTLALNTMTSLFLCMLIGYYGAYRKIIDKSTIDKLNVILLNITYPLMLISIFNIALTKEILDNAFMVFFFGVLYQFALAIIGILFIKIVKFENDRDKIIKFMMVFTNTGFIGLPLIAAVMGSTGLLYASLLNIPFNILCFSYGVYILAPKGKLNVELKTILLSPSMIGIWIGIFLLLSQLIVPGTFMVNGVEKRLPEVLDNTIEMVGSITAPLAMIIVGASLIETNVIRVLKNYKLHIFAIVKLLVAPILVYLVFGKFITDENLLLIITIFSGLPSATIGTILAMEFKLDYVYASEIVFISTLYSIITVPILFYIF